MLQKLLESFHRVAGLETVTADWESQLGTGCIDRLPLGYIVNARRVADAVPCRNKPSCRRYHDVDELPNGQLIAMLVDEDISCPTFKLQHEDRVCWRLDLNCMVREVGEALGLEGAPEELASDMWRLGTIPKESIPVVFSFAESAKAQAKNAAMIAAQRNPTFVFIVPTTSTVSQPLRDLVSAASGHLGILADDIALDSRRRLVASDRWRKYRAENLSRPARPSPPLLSGRASFTRGNTWPHARPENATWSDVVIAMHLQEVAISFGASQAKFDYREIDGFTDRRGGKKPNRLWHLLRAFAIKDGTLPLPRKDEDPVRIRTLAELDRVLGRFFDLSESAFQRESAERRVRTRFRLRLKT